MDDIVNRLRTTAINSDRSEVTYMNQDIIREAADEIERLRRCSIRVDTRERLRDLPSWNGAVAYVTDENKLYLAPWREPWTEVTPDAIQK